MLKTPEFTAMFFGSLYFNLFFTATFYYTGLVFKSYLKKVAYV